MANDLSIARIDEELINSLSQLCASVANANSPFAGMGYQGVGAQASMTDTLFLNNRWYLISNLRQLLTQLYVEHGICQTLVDQPVDDAFRAGFEIKTGQLSPDEIEQLKIFDDRNNVTANLVQAIKWARLYGGGAILIITDQDPMTPLDIKAIKKDSPLQFRAVDMWELYFAEQNTQSTMAPDGGLGEFGGEFYDYYGHPIHKSRVYRIIGKQCPSFLRPRLRGWGMSEFERLVRSLNQYLKNQDVIFDLLDEAKVDVYRIKGFNTALAKKGGTQQVSEKIQLSNQLKSFNNALVMDGDDEYDQKQITFAGLAEVLLQIRQGLAADLKMPMTKLFGISAAGFSSGEDDIENYNSMLESEIRNKNRFTVVDLLQICCQKLFETHVDDLMIEFNPLRILNAKEEEEVKDSQHTRVLNTFNAGLATAQEAKQAMNKDSLLGVELDETTDALPPIGADLAPENEAKGNGGKQAKAEA